MSEPAEIPEPLSALQPGQRARVVEIAGPARGRIMELGLTIGVIIDFVRFAPLGDPMEFKVRGSHLSLRKADAANIRVARL